jgi:hypothetical protein
MMKNVGTPPMLQQRQAGRKDQGTAAFHGSPPGARSRWRHPYVFALVHYFFMVFTFLIVLFGCFQNFSFYCAGWSMIKIFGQNEFKEICMRAGVKENFQGKPSGNSRGFHNHNQNNNNGRWGQSQHQSQNQNHGWSNQRKQFSERSDISWTSR